VEIIKIWEDYQQSELNID